MTDATSKQPKSSTVDEQPQVEQWDGYPDDDAVLTRLWEQLRQQGVKAYPVKKPSEKKQQDNQP